MKIIVIDDTPEQRDLLVAALNSASAGRYEIEAWEKDQIGAAITEGEDENLSNAPEDALARYFLQHFDEIACIVVDHDLVKIDPRLSDGTIVRASKEAYLPVCCYARKPRREMPAATLQRLISDVSYRLNINTILDSAAAASDILNVADGFATIRHSYAQTPSDVKSKGPAAILSYCLGKPALESYFKRYLSSASLTSEVINLALIAGSQATSGGKTLEVDRKTVHLLGCWLYNTILTYPGLLLNQVAASAFLGIDPETFSKHLDFFAAAKYSGPFSAKEGFWWRHDIENILISEDVEDGIELFSKRDINASPSTCCVSGESPAYFYCILKRLPVSEAHSTGALSWIPVGADLCRVNNDDYEAIAPMMGF